MYLLFLPALRVKVSSLKLELAQLRNTYLLFLAVLCPRFSRESDILQEEIANFKRLQNLCKYICTSLYKISTHKY